jgi:hypothetical protein
MFFFTKILKIIQSRKIIVIMRVNGDKWYRLAFFAVSYLRMAHKATNTKK